MSKWRKPLKNTRRIDARYFLNETTNKKEEVVENSLQQEKLKTNFHDFSFDSWLTEEKIDEGHDGATKCHSEERPATKEREAEPFDYEKGAIGDEVVEETVIGDEEEEQNYGDPPEEYQGTEIEDIEEA